MKCSGKSRKLPRLHLYNFETFFLFLELIMMCGNAGNNTTHMIETRKHSLQVPDIFLMFVALLGVLLNGLLLIFGRKNLPKSCSIFICNLAAADLATALVALVLGFRRLITCKMFRRIIGIISWSTVLASFLTLLGIALQRYIAVVHSVWSHSRMKNHQWFYKLIITGIWLVALVFALFLHYYSRVTMLIITCLSEIMIIVIIVLYLKIYSSFRSYRVKDKEGIFAANERRLTFNLKKEAKLSMIVCCVTAMLVIGVLPNVIILQTMQIMALSGKKIKCMKILHDVNSYWVVIEVLGFSLNPLIYFWHLQMSNKISSDGSIERFRRTLGFPRTKRRIVPELTITQSRPTEMTNSVCLAEKETTQVSNTMTSSC